MSINDNITIGSYLFTVNPNKYSVNYDKLKSSERSLNGTLITTYVLTNDATPVIVIKRTINIGGISDNQLTSILTEFAKNTNLTFIDIYNETFTVQFDDFEYEVTADAPLYPTYTITLSEV
jgi:hypothetical protein